MLRKVRVRAHVSLVSVLLSEDKVPFSFSHLYYFDEVFSKATQVK